LQSTVSNRVTVVITITNRTEKKIPAETRVVIEGNGFFGMGNQPLTRPIDAFGGREQVTFELQTLRDAPPIDLVNGEIVVSLVNPQAWFFSILATRKIPLNFSYFNSGLGHDFKGKNFNILLFGPQSSGKSSLIQTILTMLNEGTEILTGVLPVACTALHCSIALRKIPFKKGDCTGFFWDTWGLSRNDYLNGELSQLIKGKCQDGQKISDPLKLNDEKESTEMDAVIFMVSYGLDDVELGLLSGQVRLVLDLGMTPIVVISQVDADKSANIVSHHDHKNFQLKKELVHQRLKISEMMIFPSVSYRRETTRSFEIDRLAYKILQFALKHAHQKRQFAQNLRDL